MRNVLQRLWITICLTLCLQAGASGDPTPFQITLHPIDETHLSLEVQVAPGTQLYRDAFHIASLETQEQGSLIALLPLQSGALYQQDVHIPIQHTFRQPFTLSVHYQGCQTSGLCYPPQEQRFQVTPLPTIFSPLKVVLTLFSFFIMGLFLSLTPCVLPMLPILAGIISADPKRTQKWRGLFLSAVYVFTMSLSYALLGILAGQLGYMLQGALQKPLFVLPFSLLLIGLGLSVGGWLKVALPSGCFNKLRAFVAVIPGGSVRNAALLGALATLLASPCVSAPLIGALSFITTTHNPWLGGFALWFLGLGLGVPLLLLGALEGRFLPRSGPWMQRINQGFGLALIILALYLLWPLRPQTTSAQLPPPIQSSTMASSGARLLSFHAHWCSTCQTIRNKVLNPLKAQTLRCNLEEIDLSDFNTSEAQDLMRHHQVIAPPVSILLAPSGAELGRWSGEEALRLPQAPLFQETCL